MPDCPTAPLIHGVQQAGASAYGKLRKSRKRQAQAQVETRDTLPPKFRRLSIHRSHRMDVAEPGVWMKQVTAHNLSNNRLCILGA